MTIDEAITFVENAADYDIYNDEQAKISENYRQIASMLRELKSRRLFALLRIQQAIDITREKMNKIDLNKMTNEEAITFVENAAEIEEVCSQMAEKAIEKLMDSKK